MTILCGTDFSTPAARAVDAAAFWARVRGTTLRLVTVLDIAGADEVLAQDEDARVTQFFRGERARLEGLLQQESERIAAQGLVVEIEVLAGRADEAIVLRAAQLGAELLVVGAVGRRGDKLWRLGSTADRIAQSSHSPVLVVRDEHAFREWAAGKRPLHVIVGVDVTPTSDAALSWVRDLASRAPVAAQAVYVYWPPRLRDRLRVQALALGEGDRAIQRELEGELQTRIASIAGDVSIPLRFVGGLGRPADHLAQIAAEEKTDTLVIGTHQRTGVSRMWHGSVSHDVIVRAPANVVVVPAHTHA